MVKVTPSEVLPFRRPFTQANTENILLENDESETIAFKVKTTSPKQYCVRPNQGTVSPGQSIKISVVLQPMKEKEMQEPFDYKCKDKFLLQFVKVPKEQEATANEIWSLPEKKAEIRDVKIRVEYLPAHGSPAHTVESPSDENGEDYDSKKTKFEESSEQIKSEPTPAQAPAPIATRVSEKTTSRLEEMLAQQTEKNQALSLEIAQLKRASVNLSTPSTPKATAPTKVDNRMRIDIYVLFLALLASFFAGLQFGRFY